MFPQTPPNAILMTCTSRSPCAQNWRCKWTGAILHVLSFNPSHHGQQYGRDTTAQMKLKQVGCAYTIVLHLFYGQRHSISSSWQHFKCKSPSGILQTCKPVSNVGFLAQPAFNELQKKKTKRNLGSSVCSTPRLPHLFWFSVKLPSLCLPQIQFLEDGCLPHCWFKDWPWLHASSCSTVPRIQKQRALLWRRGAFNAVELKV